MNKDKIIQLNNKEYHFRGLSIDNQTLVFNLFNECKDYFCLAEGREAEEKKVWERLYIIL